jgi:NAD(P)-dependent dehydrogenase (short-subunit alcohol dehydrogenase family)
MGSKIILITGSTDGIGKAAARALASQGHTVIIHGRSEDKARAVCQDIRSQTGNNKVDMLVADLLSLADVRRMAEEFKVRYDRLDVLINNAGAIFGRKREVTADGHEKTMTLNVFAPMLLTELLMDELTKSPSARIVNTSSLMYTMAPKPDFGDLQMERRYTAMSAYAASKLYVLWNTWHLAAELERKGVRNITVNALHPGVVATRIGQVTDKGVLYNLFFKLAHPFMTKPDKGAATTVYLAASQDVEGVSGKMFAKQKEMRTMKIHHTEQHEQMLWDYCVNIIRPYTDAS